MHRRRLLQSLIGLPLLYAAGAYAQPPKPAQFTAKTLLLVELKGGNDGLNTVIPYRDPLYKTLRPTLGLPAEHVLPLNEQLAMHPALKPILPVWQAKELAWVLGVGYPQPNLSHFRSIDIWNTGSGSEYVLDQGWLARLLASVPLDADRFAHGIVLDGDSGPLAGTGVTVIALSNPERFLQQALALEQARAVRGPASLKHVVHVQEQIQQSAHAMQRYLKDATLPGGFPDGPLGQQARLAAHLILRQVPVPVIKIAMPGFDTHVRQLPQQERLLGQLAQVLANLRKVFKQAGRWSDVLVMTYSEFGRRPAQNASHGTDHGTAAPHLFMGGGVKGGFYGRQPSLEHLANGNLQHTVDYRQLYSTVSKRWWHKNFPGFSPLDLV